VLRLTKDGPWILWTCKDWQAWEHRFEESCVQHKCCALAYMALSVGGMYWRQIGLLLHTHLLQSDRYWRGGSVNQWDSLRADLGFCEPFGGLTRELSNLGFGNHALAYMPLAVGDTH